METEKMEQLYQKIAEHLNEMIPSQWEKIVLYAEILDDSADIYFYFTTPSNSGYLFSHYIPEHFDVSEEIYDQLLIELQELFEELKEEFKHASADQIQEYEKHYGIVYKLNGHFISTAASLWIIVITAIIFTVISIFIFKKQNK